MCESGIEQFIALASLAQAYPNDSIAILGDGSLKLFEMYAGSVIWDGQVRRVEVNASETESLVDLGLLEEYKLEIEGRLGGIVKITAL